MKPETPEAKVVADTYRRTYRRRWRVLSDGTIQVQTRRGFWTTPPMNWRAPRDIVVAAVAAALSDQS